MIQELGGNLVPIAAIVLGIFLMVIWVVMATLDSVYKTKCNFRLKEKLIERGATAAEIDQILNSGTKDPANGGVPYVQPVRPVKTASR